MKQREERFERVVAEMLSEVAPSRPPVDLVPLTERAVDRTRRWPRWFAYLKEPPMRRTSTVAVGSPTARVAAIVLATLLLVVALAGVGIAGSQLLSGDEPIIVDQDGNGTVVTIAEGVALAEDGDTILLRPGTYVESIVIDKDITLRGDAARDEVVLSAPADGPTLRIGQTSVVDPYAVLLSDSSATLSDITLRGLPSQILVDGGAPVIERLSLERVGKPTPATRGIDWIPNAILIMGESSAVVRDNELRQSGPIATYGEAEPLIEENALTDGSMITIYGAGDGAIVRDNTIRGAFDSGIFVVGRGVITIEGNLVVEAGGDGIVVGHHQTAGIDPILRANTIVRSKVGIHVGSAAAPAVSGNTIESNETGLLTGSGSFDLIVADNEFLDNDVGIAIGRNEGRFEGNTVQGGTSGIVMEGGGSPTLLDNSVEGASEVGVLIGGSTSPILEGNRVCDNARNVVIEGEGALPIDDSNEICEDAIEQ